jgi:hypothetical protein
VFVNKLLPLVIYQVMHQAFHATDLVALTVAMIAPLLSTLMTFLLKRRIDLLGAFVLAGFVLDYLLAYMTGDARFLLLRDSLFLGCFGLVCLVSLAFPQPMAFTIYTYLSAGGDLARDISLETLWQHGRVRSLFRLATFIGGCVLMLLTLLEVFLVFSLSASQVLALSSLFTCSYALLGGGIFWLLKSALRHARETVAAQPTQPLYRSVLLPIQ